MQNCIDPYRLQKLALKPLLEAQQSDFPSASFLLLQPREKEALAQFIEKNALGPMWLEIVGKDCIENFWTKEWRERLQKQYKEIVFRYTAQIKIVRSVTKILEENSIQFAFFKGVHTRELIYKHPTARYSYDIDLLIHESDKNAVIETLLAQGYILSTNPKNLSHEASLLKDHIDLDLHWHVMRPGRIPKYLTNEFLNKRIRQNGYWSLTNEDNLFILLTHSVFTKYLSIPRASLILLLDLVFWLKQPVNWVLVYSLLKKTGLVTAAWITLEYLNIITGLTPPLEFRERLAPSPLKQWYLRQWIYKDLHSRFLTAPFVPKLLFTLFAHDTFKDVFAFLAELSTIMAKPAIFARDKKN
jgi:hypothetical protein